VNDFLTQPELVEKHRHLLLVIQASLERNEASTIKYQFKIDKSSQQAIRLERLGLPLYVTLDPTDQNDFSSLIQFAFDPLFTSPPGM
jgi:hypothetical protein